MQILSLDYWFRKWRENTNHEYWKTKGQDVEFRWRSQVKPPASSKSKSESASMITTLFPLKRDRRKRGVMCKTDTVFLAIITIRILQICFLNQQASTTLMVSCTYIMKDRKPLERDPREHLSDLSEWRTKKLIKHTATLQFRSPTLQISR